MSETLDEAVKAAATEAAKKAGAELWENKSRLLPLIKRLAGFLGLRSAAPSPGGSPRNVLILGPGGTGKSTLARFLSGDVNVLLDPPGYYEPSFGVETVPLLDTPGVELVVMPGQSWRFGAEFQKVSGALANGDYRGVIVVVDYGHHAVEFESWRHHKLATEGKRAFLGRLLAEQRQSELDLLDRLVPLLQAARRKTWVLVVVLKEDVWADKRAEVVQHYTGQGTWATKLTGLTAARPDDTLFLHTVFASLHIQNYATTGGEVLKRNVAGYDAVRQRKSVEDLARILDAVREWEGRT